MFQMDVFFFMTGGESAVRSLRGELLATLDGTESMLADGAGEDAPDRR